MPNLDAAFFALSDPTRRAILARLATGEASVTDLAEPFDISQPAVSKHLKILERGGLITRTQAAQKRLARANPAAMMAVTDWLEDYKKALNANYGRLDVLLEELKSAPDGPEKD